MTLAARISQAWSALTTPAPRQERAMTPTERYSDSGRGGIILNGSKFRGGLPASSSIYGMDHEALRSRSRRVKWESTEAEALVSRLVDNIIGTGLSVQASPIWELLEPKVDAKDTKEQERRHALKRNIEVRHNLYLNSTEPDATRFRSGYMLQDFEAQCLFWDGEVFKVFRYSDNPARMSPLYFQFYTPSQIIQPTDASQVAAAKARGNRICDGIELTSEGEEVAIYVAEATSSYSVGGIEVVNPIAMGSKTTRIPFFGESGRRFVSHPKITDEPGQVRGTPLLANVIHELMKITDGTVAELEAMVINALFAVWVEPGPDAANSNIVANLKAQKEKAGDQTVREDGSKVVFDRAGIADVRLKGAEKFHSFDTVRPNLNVTEFVERIAGGIAAAKGMAPEFAKLKFDTAYTAARAAVLATWVKIEKWRDIIDVQSVGLEFRAWFIEEVNAKRLKVPGFGKSAILTEAWLSHKLLGSSMPSLDPLKEVNAVEKRLELGHTTGEAEAMKYNGSDFTENVSRQKIENVALAEARAPLVDAKTGQLGLNFGDDEEPQGDDPSAPGYDSKLDENSSDYDPDYVPGAKSAVLGGVDSPDTIKLEFDGYGVGVRAGAISPQIEDEEHWRKRAGLPPMSADAKAAWNKDKGVRRPITLAPTPGSGTTAPGGASAPSEDDPEAA